MLSLQEKSGSHSYKHGTMKRYHDGESRNIQEKQLKGVFAKLIRNRHQIENDDML